MVYKPEASPQANLDTLAQQKYPGRLLVVGRATTGLAMQVYIVGGRSDASKNRILIQEDKIVSTAPYDSTQSVGDPRLTIYDAMRRSGSVHVVSNGDQTTTAVQFLRSGKTFVNAMNRRLYEPDKPNYTPRISGFTDVNPETQGPGIGISVVSKNPLTGGPLRRYWQEGDGLDSPDSGTGYAIHTYDRDVSDGPLPSYRAEPFLLPLERNVRDTANMLWERLHPETRVAIAVKSITPSGYTDIYIRNQHFEQ